MRLLLLAGLTLACAACDTRPDLPPGGPDPSTAAPVHIETFGGAGCDLVRPGAPDGDYLDEVAAFSTTAHLCPPGHTIEAAGLGLAVRNDCYAAPGVPSFVDATGLFFETLDGHAPSRGPALRLSFAAAELWDGVAEAADLVARSGSLTAIYLTDEPTWNGLSASDLGAAARLVQAMLPMS